MIINVYNLLGRGLGYKDTRIPVEDLGHIQAIQGRHVLTVLAGNATCWSPLLQWDPLGKLKPL